MLDPPLDVLDGIPGIAFVPRPIQVLGDATELDDEVLTEVFRFDLASLFSPKPDQTCFIVAHDDPGVRTAYELTAVPVDSLEIIRAHA
jgi:hypothetical protein